jgi:hypothetical protein
MSWDIPTPTTTRYTVSHVSTQIQSVSMSEYNESVEPGHSNPETHLRQDGQPDHRFKEVGDDHCIAIYHDQVGLC